MTSRLMSLLKILGPRSATTIANPNSWAVVSLWRRLFQQQEEEEQQIREILCEILGITVETHRPVASEVNHLALQDYTRDGHRNNMAEPTSPPLNPFARGAVQQQQQETSRPPTNGNNFYMQTREAQQIHTPNLSIPDGDAYLTLPQ